MKFLLFFLLPTLSPAADPAVKHFEQNLRQWNQTHKGRALEPVRLLPLYEARKPVAKPELIPEEWMVEAPREDAGFFEGKGFRVLYQNQGYFLLSGVNACSKLTGLRCWQNRIVKPEIFDLECDNALTQVDNAIQNFAEQIRSQVAASTATCQLAGAVDIPSRGIYKSGMTNPSPGERTRFKKHGLLPRDWAQQLVGSDLIRTYLGSSGLAQLQPPKIGVMDSDFALNCLSGRTPTETGGVSRERADCERLGSDGRHGVHVHNIIFHPRYGAEVTGRAESFLTDHGGISGDRNARSASDETRILRTAEFYRRTMPRILNFSGGRMGGDEQVEIGQFQDLRRRGIIYVQSSGNWGPGRVDASNIRSGGILVGSIDPDGENSSFCQCDGATISAPSNDSIQAFLPNGDSHRFGGTSGAAPMVSGLIANALSAAPGLNDEQVRKLLQATALRIPRQDPPMANGFKLFLAAQEVQKRCGRERNFKACADRAVNDPALTQFYNLASIYDARADELAAKPDCESQQIAASLYRASYLLLQDNRVAAKLGNLYDKMESPSMARFFRRAAGLPFSEVPLR